MLSADQFQVKIQWQAAHSLIAGRSYYLEYKHQTLVATVTSIKYVIHDISGEHLSARKINANETAIVNISTSVPLVYTDDQLSFLLREVQSNLQVGVGTIEYALHRATNIRWQMLDINKAVRAKAKQQQPRCIWFTGLSGSGKSTIANLLEKRLFDKHLHTYLLDGDNLRHGLNRDLGFTEADRVENIRRVAEVSRLMVDAGLIVLASFISPYNSERLMARKLFAPEEFIEIFVDTPLAECEKRDVKGLYAKARRGELKNFTGIDSPYEVPEQAELRLNTTLHSPETCVEQIMQYLQLA